MQVLLVLCGFVSVAGTAMVEYLFERVGQPSGGLELNLPCAIDCAQNSTCVWFTTVHGECSYKKEDGKRPSNHFKLVEMPNVSWFPTSVLTNSRRTKCVSVLPYAIISDFQLPLYVHTAYRWLTSVRTHKICTVYIGRTQLWQLFSIFAHPSLISTELYVR